jgi:hypothetical protein
MIGKFKEKIIAVLSQGIKAMAQEGNPFKLIHNPGS